MEFVCNTVKKNNMKNLNKAATLIFCLLLIGVSGRAQSAEDYQVSEVMSRSEMISSIAPLKLIKFSKTLDPEVQCKLWTTKIEDTIKNGNLTEKEISYIANALLPEITAEAFTQDGSKKFSKKTKKIERVLKRKFDWDDRKIFNLLSNLYTLDEFDKYWK